jgi:hypothetical protein
MFRRRYQTREDAQLAQKVDELVTNLKDHPNLLVRTGKFTNKVILICGDRGWNKVPNALEKIEKKLLEHRPYKIIEGNCRGADKFGGYAAARLGMSVDVMSAEWGKYGKSAGPIRNYRMMKRLLWYRDERGDEILVCAFHPNIEKSKGTKNMIMLAQKADVVVELVT